MDIGQFIIRCAQTSTLSVLSTPATATCCLALPGQPAVKGHPEKIETQQRGSTSTPVVPDLVLFSPHNEVPRRLYRKEG